MSFNPQIHHRRSIRLKGHDYSKSCAYFVTICCQNKNHRFGSIAGAGLTSAHIILSNYGVIANDQWQKLPLRFPNIELGAMQIMPDHMHGIIIFKENNIAKQNFIAKAILGAEASPARTANVAPTLGDVVCAYKSIVANECLKIAKANNEMLGKI